MAPAFAPNIGTRLKRVVAGLLSLLPVLLSATDWPQYRGPATDGTSPDVISTNWPVNGATVLWRNSTLTNGFSSFAVSGGRAFTQVSKDDGTGSGALAEYCVAVDANTGANLWTTLVGIEPWDPSSAGDGGAGSSPYWLGDGPRPTPSVSGGRVIVLSSGSANIPELHLLCLNATNGSVIWSNDLVAAYGASTISWDNAASPLIDNGLIFVNLHTANNNQTLNAFRISDGSQAWSSQNQNVTHTTPIMATLSGVRQVIFATRTELVSLNPTNGALLWNFTYPFSPVDTSMGASPVVYSNLIYTTAGYGRGAFVIQVGLTNGTWGTTQLWRNSGNAQSGLVYRSIWMTPVAYQGYVYTLCGENSTFLYPPLSCIEMTTGNVMWSTNNFGMGGLILVNNKLLVLTEDGQLVLAQANPNAYLELARFQAFHSDDYTPGKCWNSPAFSNGRIYAHSTAQGIAVDVSVPVAPPLKLLAPQFLNSTQLRLVIGTSDGSPIDSNRLPSIEVHATNALGASPNTWPKLTNPLVLTTNGQARLTNTINGGQIRQFYMTVEPR